MTPTRMFDIALPALCLVTSAGALSVLRPSPNRTRLVVSLLLATAFLLVPLIFG